MIYKGEIFKNKTFNLEKLIKYGFIKKNNKYIFNKNFANGEFQLVVKISKEKIDTKIIEISTNEEYGLIYVEGITGEFVGKIREEYESILADIAEKCFVYDVFKNDYTKKTIKYIEEKYSVSPEYLWEKTPNNAIFREQKTAKWFAVILTIQKRKVGIDTDGEVEIIDLKALPEKIKTIVDNKKYLQGYHMNKKHWFTICLDGSVNIHEIYKFIDESYNALFLKIKE